MAAARAIQEARSGSPDGAFVANSRLEGEALTKAAALDPAGQALLSKAAEAGGLSARGWTRTLRLARTIADLEGAPTVRRPHVAEALIYRVATPGSAGDPLAAARHMAPLMARGKDVAV